MNKRILVLLAALAAVVLAYFALPWLLWHRSGRPLAQDVKVLREFLSELESARILQTEGKHQEALTAFLEILDKYEDEPSVAHSIYEPHFDIAGVYRQQGKPAKAEEQYAIIIKGVTTADTIVRARLLLYELQAGSSGDGLEKLRALFDDFKHDPAPAGKVALVLAKALVARGHYREAADTACQTLLRHQGKNVIPVYQLRGLSDKALAKLAETAADPAEVYLTQVEQYSQMPQMCCSWLQKAGLHYVEARKYAAARNAFNRIARDYPGEADAQAAIGVTESAKLDELEKEAATRLTEAGTEARVNAGEKLQIVRGDLTEPTVWAPEDGTRVIVGEVRLRKGAELIIRPGARVEFTLHASLRVHGRLVARGLPDRPITFTSAADEPSLFDWDGIRFDESTGGVLEHVAISGASTGVVCEHSSPKLNSVAVTRCGFVAVEVRSDRISAPRKSAPVIADPRISDNGGAGLVFVSSDGSVEGGRISNNGGAGVSIRKGSKPVIVGTVIAGNGRAGVECFDNSNATLEKVVVSGNRGPGIHVVLSAPTITDAEITRNSGAGVDWSDGSNGTIRKSRIVENAAGISCRLASSPAGAKSPLLIEQCRLRANRQYGVRCVSASYPTIRGNIFEALVGPGILIEDISGPIITGNAFPPQGVAIRHEGTRKINASDNVWPSDVQLHGLVEITGQGKVKMP